MWNRWTVLALIVIIVPILVIYAVSLFAARPSNLGVKDGLLAPCPASPNCVCSQAEDAEHAIEALKFTGTAAEAMTRLKKALAELPRMQIITEKDDYLHVECQSLIFRYTDDVVFWIDALNQTIHFRSASRVGRSDFGVNRERMEIIRRAFEGR